MNGSLLRELKRWPAPESLLEPLQGEPGTVLLRSALPEAPGARYSFLTSRPFLRVRCFGSRFELEYFDESGRQQHAAVHYGNPWQLLDALLGRYELLDEADWPFPLGGCFGYWGYDLKHFVEPRLPRRALDDLELPDCVLGFYDHLLVFDHQLGRAWIVATGLDADGSRSAARARARIAFWEAQLDRAGAEAHCPIRRPEPNRQTAGAVARGELCSNLTREQFLEAVERAQSYIRAGHIYQVNLSQRLSASCAIPGRELFLRLRAVSPAPFAAYLDCGGFELASASPEQFLRLSGAHILTRPIKGTRPRSGDPVRDAQLAWELQTSPKELAELVMITDLLRNDLGRVCEYGSVQVPELVRLERYAQVQHLVSTIEGRLRPEVTHLGALAACFPGGSITGAPKIRAMEIIEELEPTRRGPYCGCHGYLGFNRESQLSITIRTAICHRAAVHFQVGAGIVADSSPEAEYDETLAKAAGFLAALGWECEPATVIPSAARPGV